MIDLEMLRRAASGPGHEVIPVTRRLLNELLKLGETPRMTVTALDIMPRPTR